MQKIKLLELVRDSEGGMKRHVEQLLWGLDKAKFDIFLALSDDNPDTWNLEKLNVKVHSIKLGDRRSPIAVARSLFDIVRLLKKEGIEIIHAHGLAAAIIGTTAALAAGTPFIVTTVHNFPKENFINRAAGHLLRRNHKIITVSHRMAREISRMWAIPTEKIEVIYNGIDPHLIAKYTGSNGECRQKPVAILNISRLIPDKGVDVFLKACAILVERLSNDGIEVVFYIAGNGPLERELKNLVSNLRLEGRVNFLGFCRDIYRIMQNSDMLVLSSRSEGLSLSLLEAMAMGKPVIATDVGGNPEIIRHGVTGMLVPPDNPRALAEAMEYVIKNPGDAEKMARTACRTVMERYTHEHMIEAVQNLLISLVNQSG
ncbi:glycosyltransferase family 4 protein [Thermosediminibacter oceani]|uniref:Glycosyl transferase group 1 n=1 Tax=Thermosediminibacter oceani (strain ATCC BAA-1034 / DSM 16646 / JW/IW-1228P) TaxID=555079 RepID=D9RY45_THEOJ|nr:glycosyltransferase family 4 protein [Thermosediminibacter oceani]ADL08269.1 glycosyl transferase group 1 [Thermosediminibacter oceani DSM 16646]